MSWDYEWITDWETIYSEAFQQKWLDWYNHAESSHVFFHPVLGKAWIDTYLHIRDIDPLFCIAKEGESTIFMPFILWKRNWKNAYQRVIIPLGHSDYDYHDPILVGKVSDQQLNLFWEQLTFQLNQRCSYDKIEINGIRSNCNGMIKEDDVAPFCNIGVFKNSVQLSQSLSTSLRGDINRQMKRLQEKCKLSYFIYNFDTLDEALASFPEFLEKHRTRWPNAYKAPNFHYRLINDGIKSGIVHFSELRLDNKPISWHLGFVSNCRFYYYMPVIDQDFASYSPGKLHIFKLMEEAIERKIIVFDHLRGAESYKTGWAKGQSPLYEFTMYNNSFPGRIRNWMVEDLKKRLSE